MNLWVILPQLTYGFPDCSEPVPVPTFFISAPAALNVWAFFLAIPSAALWFDPPQYKHLSFANLFAVFSAKILLLPTLMSICTGPVYPATVPAGAVSWVFGGVGGLGQEVKPIPPVEIVVLEKLDCIVSKSATRPYIYEYKCECVCTDLCMDPSGRQQSPVIWDSPPAIWESSPAIRCQRPISQYSPSCYTP